MSTSTLNYMYGETHAYLERSLERKNASEISPLKEKALATRNLLLSAPKAPCRIIDFIDYQIRLRPYAPAVQFQSEKPVTYAELDQLTTDIATAISFTPGQIVPVCMNVSVRLVGTILAILRSGASYLILDPEGSTERNNGIVEDSNATFVIVSQAYAPLFNNSLSLDGALSNKLDKSATWRQGVTETSDAAYLIYTSG